MHIMAAPKTTATRRPRPSIMYGENGYAARQPMFCEGEGEEEKRVRVLVLVCSGAVCEGTHLDGTEQTKLGVGSEQAEGEIEWGCDATDLPAGWPVERLVPLW